MSHLGYIRIQKHNLSVKSLLPKPLNQKPISYKISVDTWLTEFWIDRIHVVLQKRNILYV